MKIAYVVADLKRVGPSNQTLNIIKNSCFRKDSIVITLFAEPSDSMKSDFENEGIKIRCLNLRRAAFILGGYRKLKKVLKEWKADIVHSYGVKPDYVCQKACKHIDAVHIITLRNYPREDILTRMGSLKGKIALYSHLSTLKKAKYIVACSNTIKEKMKKDFPNMNITTIQNGVDIEKYSRIIPSKKMTLRKEMGLKEDKKIFISVGSFIKRKRIGESVEGFLKYDANAKNDSEFLLLGDGPELQSVRDKYKNRKVKFLGKISNTQDYLHVADAFISSSESEGLPNGVIEAIACGVPVLLSNIKQHEEVLEEVPDSGIEYKLGDVDDLASKMRKILEYDNSKSDISGSNLTMKAMSEKYMVYYKRIEDEIRMT